MRRLSAQYVITNAGPLLKRPVITVDDDGIIISIEDTGGDLKEKASVEFYNGIIIPGFVNCHCHLELSHMRGTVARGTGLGHFIGEIRNTRAGSNEIIISSAVSADNGMFREGISLCADICNSSLLFGVKKESRVRYKNLLEVFGIDPDKASKRISELDKVAEEAAAAGLPYSLVPHALYSMSVTLLRLLREKTVDNTVTSVHFMETPGEAQFLKTHSGPLMESYERSGIIPSRLETVISHSDAVMNEITLNGSLIVVHGTFADRDTIRTIMKRKNLFWCMCPNSNLYIEGRVPPLDLLRREGCEIVIGTDSLASNSNLSIVEEIKTLQLNFPATTIEELVLWATLNGARALGEEESFGKLETGKKPGIVLLQDLDLSGMKFLPGTYATRLI
jgi:cytosine/adenosine deaminase-related metal-dependent hydrolase